MKKLLVALLLSVILTMTFASPAFAGGPPDNNPGLEIEEGPGWYGLVSGALLGISNNWAPGVGMGRYTIDALVSPGGGPPVKWQCGHWK